MSSFPASAIPAWQTEELQEEWVDLDEEEEQEKENDSILTYGTRSISLTAPLATQIHTNCDISHVLPSSPGPSTAQVGTFLVREDQPNLQINLKTPGQKKKGLIKDFFSPLPLERMFEPPSPPRPNAQNTAFFTPPMPHTPPAAFQDDSNPDEIVATDLPGMVSFHGHKSRMTHRFTFSVPRAKSSRSNPATMTDGSLPVAQSTPTRPGGHPQRGVPATDSRLKLFRFQYDTYTREHLSALVDSIAVNSGAGTTPSPTTFSRPLSRLSEAASCTTDSSVLRSAKRIKLSPPSDFIDDGRGSQPQGPRLRDYVGESRSLMQQIKSARDFSTVSSAPSVEPTPQPSPREEKPPSLRPPSALQSVSRVPSSTAASTPSRPYTSASYRQKAEALMSQIKKDMKGNKRIFSGDTAASSEAPSVESKFSISQPSSSQDLPSPDNSLKRLSKPSKSRKTSSRKQKSPTRKHTRHPSASTLDSQLSEEISQLSLRDVLPQPIQPPAPQPPPSLPPTLAPASDPTLSLRTKTDDLIRFVSSSTATGSTLTAGRAPSYSKHAGPAHIRTIAPTDLPELPDKLGDMRFDKVMMKWVKNTALATQLGQSSGSSEDISDDPFRDIESLRDDSQRSSELADEDDEEPVQDLRAAEISRIEEQPEFDDEELELNSFSTDDPSALIVDVMTGIETADEGDETTDSEVEVNSEEQPAATSEPQEYDADNHGNMSLVKLTPTTIAATSTALSTSSNPATVPEQVPHSPVEPIATPGPKPALKSRSATPQSVLKNPNRAKFETPASKIPRSVSFSDGKRDGPIRDLAEGTDVSEHNTSGDADPTEPSNANASQSARSKRIAQMLDALHDDESDGSPSKQSKSHRSSSSPGKRRSFTRSHSQQFSVTQNGNATFLTECSFGVSHDRLVEVITDVQPFVPHWDQLNSIDLSNKKLESVARLKEFLPRLDALNLNSNQLAWLSGIPGTVRTLSVASNGITGLTSYSHLLNLENLDISRNDIESLNQLSCLRHLRELKADGNQISSLEGLEKMDGLIKLSVQGNKIRSVNLVEFSWARLEMLNLSQNKLEDIQGISSLQGLIALNLDSNDIATLEVEHTMAKLRILRVSGNRIQQLHVGKMANLRTLYADNNSLSTLVKLDRLTRLENLSLRNQSGRGINFLTRDVRDVKRLYVSGNALKAGFITEPCYNLVYLELAACRLTALPEDLSRLAPNLRVLNLNYNFLEDTRPLEGLTRLRKLTMIGSRLKGTKPLIRLLQRMPEVEMLDFRMNPCTLGWYLPLLVRDVPGALQPSEETKSNASWQELDAKFRRGLPNESYIGRLAYRGLIMRACAQVRLIDGVEVTSKERRKAQQLLAGLLGDRK